jgi:predicted transcriptional regulator YheO
MYDDLHPILKSILPLVEGLANTFGKNCEVVLHDVRNPDHSIVAIANGHVTNRTVGGPMSEYGLEALRKGDFSNHKINYMKKTNDGRIVKSTSLYIKDENQHIIGYLCINYDISELKVVKSILNDFMSISESQSDAITDSYGDTVNDVLERIVDKTLEATGKPAAFLSKEEKVNMVQLLESKGVFLVKGAIDYVAKILCVSRYTIYNYLEEIRMETTE